MVYRAPVGDAAWFPEVLDGELVVLRRHVAANVTAFQRWYSDPEVARLARYQDDVQLDADYIVVEIAKYLLGPDWLPTYVRAANQGGIERVLV